VEESNIIHLLSEQKSLKIIQPIPPASTFSENYGQNGKCMTKLIYGKTSKDRLHKTLPNKPEKLAKTGFIRHCPTNQKIAIFSQGGQH
jgi:hypothetical protein